MKNAILPSVVQHFATEVMSECTLKKFSHLVSWPWLEKCSPHYSTITAESIFMITMFIKVYRTICGGLPSSEDQPGVYANYKPQ